MSDVIHNLSMEEKISELEGKIDYLEAKVHALESKNPVLEMQHVEKHFGGVHAIDNFSVKIEQGQIHGLIGPNGAGKTTIFNNITGIYAPDSGKIIFMGEDITGSSPHRVAQLGIGRTFQNIRLFSNLSVLENVVIASGMDATYNLPQAIFHSEKFKKREKMLNDKAMNLLENYFTMGAVQLIINVLVVTSFMPPTGVPLPFISAGGSSLIIFLASMGVLLNISRERDQG